MQNWITIQQNGAVYEFSKIYYKYSLLTFMAPFMYDWYMYMCGNQ